MPGQRKVILEQVIKSISSALDLVDPVLVNHQKTVAYICDRIADKLGFDDRARRDVIIAASLHDIGAPSVSERISLLDEERGEVHWHGEVGYHMLSEFHDFRGVANNVRFHHWPWDGGKGIRCSRFDVPLSSHLIHLADRIDASIDPKINILSQASRIRGYIEENTPSVFCPQYVDAFIELATMECFWLDIVAVKNSTYKYDDIHKGHQEEKVNLSDLAFTLSRIIDSRSSYTAFHSASVAACAETMAQLCNLSDNDIFEIKTAGYLHDIGKLAVPQEILEKTGKLTEEEYNIVKSHPYHTYAILDCIDGIGSIKDYAAFHHEKPSGLGYPFHYDASGLSLGARILTFADILAALAEDRPYRKSLPKEKVLKIIKSETLGSDMDVRLFNMLECNYNIFEAVILKTQEEVMREHAKFWNFNYVDQPKLNLSVS